MRIHTSLNLAGLIIPILTLLASTAEAGQQMNTLNFIQKYRTPAPNTETLTQVWQELAKTTEQMQRLETLEALSTAWTKSGCGGYMMIPKSHPLHARFTNNNKSLPFNLQRYGKGWYAYRPAKDLPIKHGDQILRINDVYTWQAFPIKQSIVEITVKTSPLQPQAKHKIKVSSHQNNAPQIIGIFNDGKHVVLRPQGIPSKMIRQTLKNKNLEMVIIDLRSPSSQTPIDLSKWLSVLHPMKSQINLLVNQNTYGSWTQLARKIQNENKTIWGETVPQSWSSYKTVTTPYYFAQIPSDKAKKIPPLFPHKQLKDSYIYSEGFDAALERFFTHTSAKNLQ